MSNIRISQPIPAPVTPDFTKGNLFTVDQILALTNNANTTYDKIRDRGAIIKVTIRWSCNLDRWNPDDSCSIQYSALRMDDSTINDGNNFRFVSTYKNNGVLNRDLTKFYGVRIFFESIGNGYRVSAIQIILQLSSGLALLAVATLVCDILIQYIFPQKDQLYKRKNDVMYEHEIINKESQPLIRSPSFE
jgi:P2X purinoceptor 4